MTAVHGTYDPKLMAAAMLDRLDPGWRERAAAEREWQRDHPHRARWIRLRRRLRRLQVPIEWRGWRRW